MARIDVTVAPKPRHGRHADDDGAAGTKHPDDLLERGFVVHVLEHVEHRHDIEGAINERKPRRFATNERRVDAVVPACGGNAFRPEIQTDDVMRVRTEDGGVRTRAAADIERSCGAAGNGVSEQCIEQPAPSDEPEVASLDLGKPAEARRRKRGMRNVWESSGERTALSTAVG